MSETTTFLLVLQPLLSRSIFQQLSIISEALLMMHGRVTMLGISRWTKKGGSYRTIQRFFLSKIDWPALNWALMKPAFQKRQGATLIVGDATTVTKSGTKTFGLGRFFSSIYSRAVPGIAFQTLSLIDVASRTSWPLLVEQMKPKPKPTALPKAGKKKRSKSSSTGADIKRKRGRPKGSKNKNRREVELNTEMTQVKSLLKQALGLIGDTLQPVYFVYDGAFGNNAAVQMTRQVGLHLISKLRNDSALYFQWKGIYSGRGARPKYGERVDYSSMPGQHLKSDTFKKKVRTRVYQFVALHKAFADPLNVVVICKYNEETGKSARVILFCSDSELDWEELIDYYRLRFQIEFNFRDAKQHWGLEDFMVIKEQAVSNFANLSLFMVNLSQRMMPLSSDISVLDLKAQYHKLRYAQEVFKILPKSAELINFDEWVKRIPVLGRIHPNKIAI